MPRKGENIYKRKDGRWEGRFVKSHLVNGKTKYGYVYASTYREVKQKLANAIADSTATTEPYDETYDKDLFAIVAQEWLEYIRPQIKQSSYNKYHNLLRSYILPEFKTVRLSKITSSFLETYCNQMLTQGGQDSSGLSPKTVSDILSVIRAILKFTARNGKKIPCDGRTINIKRTPNQMRVLSREEQERLCHYLYSDLNSANVGILLCLFTGLRVGEVCALQWEDISFSENIIHVHQTMQRIQCNEDNTKTKIIITTPKSPCSIRCIPIPSELVSIIQMHKQCSHGFVLTNSVQQYIEPRTMQNRFKYALEQASIDTANYHALRHTFATRCIELGFDVKSLSEILGHATVNITMNRYVHPSMELKKENMQRLSSLFPVK